MRLDRDAKKLVLPPLRTAPPSHGSGTEFKKLVIYSGEQPTLTKQHTMSRLVAGTWSSDQPAHEHPL